MRAILYLAIFTLFIFACTATVATSAWGANGDAGVHISDARTLTPQEAQRLSEWRGEVLIFRNFESLSPAAAGNLANWSGDVLVFDRLSDLTPATAGALSQWRGQYLELLGILELSPAARSSLSQWRDHHLLLPASHGP